MATYINLPPNASADAWVTAATSFLQANVPALTAYDYLKLGDINAGVALAATNDAAIVGGGSSPTAAQALIFTRSVWQTPKTTSWGFVFRGILAAVSGATFNQLGFTNAANSHDCGITVDSTDAVSGANYSLRIHGATVTFVDSTLAVDGLTHNFAMTFDATTVKLFIDGVLKASTVTTTNLTDEASFLYAYNTTAGGAKGARLLYGYIAP